MSIYFLRDKYGDDVEMSFDKSYLEARKKHLTSVFKTDSWKIVEYSQEDDQKKIAHTKEVFRRGNIPWER